MHVGQRWCINVCVGGIDDLKMIIIKMYERYGKWTIDTDSTTVVNSVLELQEYCYILHVVVCVGSLSGRVVVAGWIN